MTDSVSRSSATDLNQIEADNLGFDTSLFLPDGAEPPNPETFTTMITTVLQPWAIESEETVSGPLRDFVAQELETLGAMTTGQMAWAVAELVVARQAEVLGSGDPAAQDGLLSLGELARMFEHVFMANSGTSLDGQPA
ncbi:hypothetical protein [uncultured Tateyamaria sp.]|uniref:hypothetical protein n=1 Tax=uncultured Tateyamaria sp. TaxID=455651 RepID=UPI00260B0EF6|nr:hypothetical protein [uncultured Tateyamaria sp.]